MKLNEIIMAILEWPADMFDRSRDWLEGAPSKRLPTMRAAFRTTVVAGGEKPRYTMEFQFATLEELHQADDEWRAAA